MSKLFRTLDRIYFKFRKIDYCLTRCIFATVCLHQMDDILIFVSWMQTWKKLQAEPADILSEIPIFWVLFKSNILHFWLRMLKEELKIENWCWITGIWGRMKEISGWRIQYDGRGLLIEDGQSRLEDNIMPYQYLIDL